MAWINPHLGDLSLHKLLLPPLNLLARLGTRGDKRKRNLPAILIRYSNDANVGYERVVEEMTLEFCWRDLETADFHDLLEAVNDENVVICIDDGLVSCADPTNKTSLVTLRGLRKNDVPIYEGFLRTEGDV